uniref:DUF2214 domain-containing protein n=1 Tax=Paulinella chromatophora TaxID=39717 RepID=B1X3F4_PAUCH|nr:hypothetical protein PCC_0011 [Paulinella chromatophora]ACB42473.1 hypothetical protein PCC_0011 [Paulinella chromatophora]
MPYSHFNTDVVFFIDIKNAIVAYAHYLSFMFCFGSLIVERMLIKVDPSRYEVISIIFADIIYGIAALTLLLSGILRVLYFGQGSNFYIENPLFWWKIGLYLFIGGFSLYPTKVYILWVAPLRKKQLPHLSQGLLKRLSFVLNIEIAGFATIPLLATLITRGLGLFVLS